MRVSLLLIFALAALVAAAESKKCKGECVSAGSCEGTETKGACEDSQVCCVTEKNVVVKRNCSPTSSCSAVNGECRKMKCLTGEKRFKNKKTKIYCEGKRKCVCCARRCENKSACNLNGGYCQPIDLPCDGTLMTEKAYCVSNKNVKGNKQCGCCIPTDTDFRVGEWKCVVSRFLRNVIHRNFRPIVLFSIYSPVSRVSSRRSLFRRVGKAPSGDFRAWRYFILDIPRAARPVPEAVARRA